MESGEEEQQEVAASASGSGDENKDQKALRQLQKADRGKEKVLAFSSLPACPLQKAARQQKADRGKEKTLSFSPLPPRPLQKSTPTTEFRSRKGEKSCILPTSTSSPTLN